MNMNEPSAFIQCTFTLYFLYLFHLESNRSLERLFLLTL